MTREETIKVLSSYDVNGVWADVDGKPYNAEEQAEAFDMAIEALNDIAKWRTWSHTYDNACMNGEPSEDLISRTEAIGALVKETEAEGAYGYTDITSIVHVISNLPSADRPRGEWINTAPSDRSDNIICDQCGYNSIARYDYCPNCGAKMDRERNEENE